MELNRDTIVRQLDMLIKEASDWKSIAMTALNQLPVEADRKIAQEHGYDLADQDLLHTKPETEK